MSYNIDLGQYNQANQFQNAVQDNSLDFGFANPNHDAQGAQTMQLRKLFMGKARPQQQQHRRTYDVYLDGGGFEAIQNKIDRHGQDAFNAMNLSDVMATSDIIKLSGSAEASVSIDNGWGTERFMFVLLVDIFRNGRFSRTEFISGYTDHTGALNTDLISTVSVDPNMVFTINHISEANMRNTDHLGNPVTMISQTNSVLTNSNWDSFNNTSKDLYMMRPSDVLKAVNKIDLHNGMDEISKLTGQPNTYRDLDSTLSRMPMMSTDQCNLIPTFTGRILNGLYSTRLAPNDPMNMDGLGSTNMAQLLTQDTPFTKNGFVNIMNRQLANGVSTTSKFSFGDLLMLDRTIDDRTSIFGRSYESGSAITFPSTNNCSILGAATQVAVHATHITQTVLALMAIAGITTIAFNANNYGGRADVVWQACEGMDYDGQLGKRLENFKARLIVECLNIVSSDNQSSFKVDVFASAINDVFIQISWNNEKEEYVFPAFAHSVTLPTVTNTMSRITDVATKVVEVVDMLDNREKAHRQQFGNSVFANTSGYNSDSVGNF